MTKQRLLLVSILVLTIVALLSYLAIKPDAAPTKSIRISGLSSCSKNIDQKVVDNLGVTLYGLVLTTNNYNKAKTLPNYDGQARSNSCEQRDAHTVVGDNGRKINVLTSSVIVDVPDPKQSWRITYDWLESGDASKIDFGILTPQCITSNELRYGNFNCTKAYNLYTYGTPDYDPILQYMPYTGEGFKLSYDPKNRSVLATINVPVSQKDNQELIQNNEAVVPYWFEYRKLDITKYNVAYTVSYE